MEANTPEKIYVHVKKDKVTNIWNSTWIGVHDVEYIRKDTFIEKACEWLKQHSEDYEYSWYNEEEHASGITEKCIEDFTKFMRGE